MLSAGNPFPNFALPNQDGKITKLSDYAGRWLVIYFYPKDDTPGCTIQGKGFTASKADFDAAGIAVVGVSADDAASHKNFCNKFAFHHRLRDGFTADEISRPRPSDERVKLGAHQFVVDPNGTFARCKRKSILRGTTK
jgi:peroxiredoxin